MAKFLRQTCTNDMHLAHISRSGFGALSHRYRRFVAMFRWMPVMIDGFRLRIKRGISSSQTNPRLMYAKRMIGTNIASRTMVNLDARPPTGRPSNGRFGTVAQNPKHHDHHTLFQRRHHYLEVPNRKTSPDEVRRYWSLA